MKYLTILEQFDTGRQQKLLIDKENARSLCESFLSMFYTCKRINKISCSFPFPRFYKKFRIQIKLYFPICNSLFEKENLFKL